jgi:hypothetical protein
MILSGADHTVALTRFGPINLPQRRGALGEQRPDIACDSNNAEPTARWLPIDSNTSTDRPKFLDFKLQNTDSARSPHAYGRHVGDVKAMKTKDVKYVFENFGASPALRIATFGHPANIERRP